ncbi:MAG: hypothetical protein C4582_10115 [Desulfobacteraceae bacterium]|nr:MAG: hypothetical protein C4582_10115 [Desulfobacteraceae bacterium]
MHGLRIRSVFAACTATLFFWLGSSPANAQPFGLSTPPASKISAPSPLSCPGGRYVFGQISDSAKDQFMLDTVTGRLWRVSESGKIGTHLKPVPYCDEKGDCAPFPPGLPQ